MTTTIVLVGPTSSGKTSLGIKLAQINPNIEIISADSRQLYKFMDIGTGKLPVDSTLPVVKDNKVWTIGGVRIWGYDLVVPNEYFSAYDFAVFAKDKISELHKLDKIPLVVGGTGFFVDVLTGRVSLSSKEPDLEQRSLLNSLSIEELLTMLKTLSSSDYCLVDKKNKVRVIRAIERNMTPKSNISLVINSDFKYFGLMDSREELYRRVDRWSEAIWGDLLFEEVNKLEELGYLDAKPLQGIVYKSAKDYLKSNMSFKEGLERVRFDLHAYIRRQQTWFKRNETISWLDAKEVSINIDVIGNALSLL